MHVEKKIIFLAFLAAPLSIILHEIGHALAALSIGYNHLYITYHSWGGNPPLSVSAIDRAWISAGGPIVSFLIALVCYFLIRLRFDSDLLQVLGMLAPIQFSGALLFVIGSILGISASTVYDTARVANYLGTNIFLTSIPGSLILPITWYFFIHLIEKKKRQSVVLSLIIGGVAGFSFWLLLFGPILLPD